MKFPNTLNIVVISGSGKVGRKEDDREELDFQFDEEIVTPKHNRSVISITNYPSWRKIGYKDQK